MKKKGKTIKFDGKTYRVFTVSQPWGEDEIFFTIEAYSSNNTLAICAWTASDEDEIEPYTDLTVNLDGVGYGSMQDNETAFVDTNNNSWAMKFIKENGLGKKIGEGHSGWCTYPLVKFNTKKFLAE